MQGFICDPMGAIRYSRAGGHVIFIRMFEGRSILPLAPVSALSSAVPPIPVLFLLLLPLAPQADRPFFLVARRYVSRHELGGSTGGSSNEIVEGRNSDGIFNLAVPPPLAFSFCPSLLSPFSGTT